jgi:ribokinase
MPELVNLGSLCIDEVYRVVRIARPGETVTALAEARFAGGKGLNQSLAAARAGCAVAHVGCVGDDGELLVDALAQAGVDTAGVRRVPGARSGHAVLQVESNGANAIVIVGGANRLLTAADIGRALAALGKGGWLLLQNEINDIESVLAAARAQGVSVAMNLAPTDGRESRYDLRALRLLIVNAFEAEALTGHAEAERALATLCEASPELEVVVTCGAEGLWFGARGERLRLPAFRVRAVDETAAGDAFVGFLLEGWIRGRSHRDALVRASAAGALAVTCAGAAPSIPDAAAVDAFLAVHRHELS